MINMINYPKGENGYNLTQIRDAQQLLKNFNRTTTKKAQHQTQLYNLKLLVDANLYDINRYLFDSDHHYYIRNYSQAIFFNESKKELDRKLTRCIESLINELEKIVYEMF
jgi:hypothetical protein